MNGRRWPGICSMIFMVAAAMTAPSGPVAQKDPKIDARNKVPLRAYPFDLNDVRLLDGPFREAMMRDQKYLLSVDGESAC